LAGTGRISLLPRTVAGIKKGLTVHSTVSPFYRPFTARIFSDKAYEIFGGGKEIRTLDPSVANAVLSQLSYAPISCPPKQKLNERIIEKRPIVKEN
jgi:hypothetical protein